MVILDIDMGYLVTLGVTLSVIARCITGLSFATVHAAATGVVREHLTTRGTRRATGSGAEQRVGHTARVTRCFSLQSLDLWLTGCSWSGG
jgi:hypothetical protein